MIHKKHLKKLIRKTKGDRLFLGLSYGFLIFFSILVILPIMNLISFSLTPEGNNAYVRFIPEGFTLSYFAYFFKDSQFITSFGNSVLLTVGVTIVSNVFMALAAYPLSKPDLPMKKPILVFFIITMLFGAGILPTKFMLQGLGVLGTLWGIFLLSINNVFNMLLYKSFYEGLPKETIEAAEVDGVNNIQLFFRIVLPMSLPVFASCCFFTIVGTWNAYSSVLMFVGSTHPESWTLSYYIYYLVSQFNPTGSSIIKTTNLVNYQSASIVISTIPILLIYPFIVRYIKSGITLGSEK
ncbi:MAG: carbohydrate ABC transporter permease [Bacilli bacterium]|nr:carbohydrate ABC transporter permease [Bacilli bacterium]